MEMLKGYFHFYDKVKNTCICPKGQRDAGTGILTKLEIIGCKVLGEIDLPIDLNVNFYNVQLPNGWTLEEDDEENWDGESIINTFLDDKGRVRFRVFASYCFSTVVFTRYWIGEDYDMERIYLTVTDLEQHGNEDEGVIWKQEKQILHDRGDAEKWLDENYPEWKDPSAYWS